jgi:hypothetical protein
MRLKAVVGILALSCALAVAVAAAQLPELEVIQLMEVNGKIPVEIVNARIEPISPHPSLAYSVSNNTTQPMNAVLVSVNVGYVTISGIRGSAVEHPFRNFLLHPDIREAFGFHGIAPGGEQVFWREPLKPSPPIAAITSVTMNVDYADFADGSSVGPNQYGTTWIIDARKGAVKYKNWLKDKHKDKSEEEVESLLMNPRPPAEIGFEGGEEHGAQMYMSSMRSAIRRGIDVTKYLK